MPRILAIESTCDETAAALVEDGFRVRSSVVASQAELHAKYRGVVPEIASRAHIENMLPVIREAMAPSSGTPGEGWGGGLEELAPLAGAPSLTLPRNTGGGDIAQAFADIDAIAVAHRPGLIGSLLIGVTAAKTLAWSLGKPLIGVDHVHAHLYSVVLETNAQPPMPAVGLVCSGGHTAMYRLRSWTDVELIGSTIDDAVGEAYDKVAAILGLGYPGGPIIDRLATQGDPQAIHFPRSTLGRESLDFSFSGLKTAVLYHVRGVPTKDGPRIRDSQIPPPIGQPLFDICASFQAACIDVLRKKLTRAAEQTGAKSLIIGGGVSANLGLRAELAKLPIPVFVPPLKYCTDNAAMIGGLAHVLLEQNKLSDLNLDALTQSQIPIAAR
jgi:N6-L-threonylcarbamoyladenine synthase